MNKQSLSLFPMLLSLALLACISLTSCQQEEPTSRKQHVLLLNPGATGEDTYDMALVGSNGTVSYITVDEIGRVMGEDIVLSDGKTHTSITYYEDGRVRSISNNMGSLVFSNYQGHQVDVAAIDSEGNMEVVKQWECDVDWDQTLQTRAMAPRRGAYVQDVIDEAVDAQDVIPGYNVNRQWLQFIKDSFGGLIKFTAAGAAGAGTGKIISSIVQWQIDTSLDAMGFALDPETKVYSDRAKLLADVGLSGFFGPVGVAAALIGNYGTLEGMFTDAFLAFLEWNEARKQRDNIELAEAALNSGMGTLKVTLAWNFYADIDLHAVEPNGTRIYWNDKFSSVTGGFLDVDNRYGYRGSAENIFWANPENGVYKIYLHYYGPSLHEGMEQSGVCSVTVLYLGSGHVYRIPMSEEGQVATVTSIQLPSGMLDAPATPSGPTIELHLVPKPMPTATEHGSAR